MPVRSPVHVGREPELSAAVALLCAPLPDAPGDQISVLLVEGDGGVGKTRLVAEAVAAAARERPDLTFVQGAAYAGGADVPFVPWLDALHDLSRQWGVEALASAAGTAAPDFAALVPDLAAAVGGEVTTGAGIGRPAQLLPWLWEQLAAHGPLVVVLEDMHAADPGSTSALLRLTRQSRGPLRIVVTGRPGGDARDHEAARRWRDVVAELHRTATEVIELAPLDEAEVVELAARLLREADANGGGRIAETAEALGAASAGVPFVVEQLVAAHLDGRPVEQVPGDPRVASLPELSTQAADVLAVLAVHGAEVDPDLIAVMTGCAGSALESALHEGLSRGVIVRRDESYAVAHALVAEWAREQLLPSERRRWHELVASALSTRPADPRAVAALPAHREAAGDVRGALVASLAAGQAAAYAPAVAARHYARAAALWATVDDAEKVTGSTYDEVLELAATRSAQAGDVEAAVELARGWLEGEAATSSPARASRLSLLIASRGEWVLPAEEVSEAFDDAIAWARRADGANLSAALNGRARHLATLDRNAAAEPLARQALDSAEDDAQRAYAAATLGGILVHLGDHDAGAEQLRSALARMDPVENPEEHARTLFELVWTEFYAGRAATARDLALETVQSLRGAGTVTDVRASLLGAAAQIEVWLGRWGRAGELLARGEREDPAGRGEPSRLVAAAELALRSGRLAEARVHAMHNVAHWELLGMREYDHIGLNLAAECALADGDHDTALALSVEATRSLADTDTVYELATTARGAALVLARVRPDTAQRRALLTATEEIVARLDGVDRFAATCVPAAELATASAALADAHGAPSTAAWSTAAQTWADLGFPWWENRCRLSYAEGLLRSRGARASAEPVVSDVRDAARVLGATGLVRDAEELAAAGGLSLGDAPSALGDRPGTGNERPGADPLAVLTAREREVLDLLAEGASNRQIATTLFISEKTASVHVSHILAKLGVSSRLQAAAVAHGQRAVQVSMASSTLPT